MINDLEPFEKNRLYVLSTGEVLTYEPFEVNYSVIEVDKIPEFESKEVYDYKLFYNGEFYPKYEINENKLWAAIQDINILCDKKILAGYNWRGYDIWLSSENLFNFKALYDLAKQGTPVLPVTFKFAKEYYTFEHLHDLEDFYIGSVNHIHQCLNECWEKKNLLTLLNG